MPPGWAPCQPGSTPQRALSPRVPGSLCVGWDLLAPGACVADLELLMLRAGVVLLGAQ